MSANRPSEQSKHSTANTHIAQYGSTIRLISAALQLLHHLQAHAKEI
ncbi:hypothetical protein AF72_01795 [Xylella taiwanensis]|uniref:Uncharacterized protein n=1 Tax=Xylella taiwanensis TaxID=1444770 RepID=Z9JM63_9GAMM|nr:hypothetical protein AF72_01795 [Xylella taiwanensis]